MSTYKTGFSPSRLREARRKKKLTIAQLAAAVGVSASAAGHWESGKNIPKPEKIKRLASVLGISTNYFEASEESISILDKLSETDREFLGLLANSWNLSPLEALRRSLKDSLSRNMQERTSKQPSAKGDISVKPDLKD